MYYEDASQSPDGPSPKVPALNDDSIGNILNQSRESKKKNDNRKEEEKKEDKDTKKAEKKEKKLLIMSEYFSSRIREEVAVLFSVELYPSKKIHPFLPFISYMRNLLVGLSLFAFKKEPFAQVTIILVIEIVYMAIILLYTNKADIADNIIDIFNCVTNSLFVSLKLLTVFSIDDDTRQYVYGRIMAAVLVVNFVGNMVYVVYSICMILIDIGRVVVRWYKMSSDDKKMYYMNSKWIDTFIYEFSLQPQAGNGQRVPTPIIVEEPEEGENDIRFIMPRPMRINPPATRNNRVMNERVNRNTFQNSNIGQTPINRSSAQEVQKKEVVNGERGDMMMDDIIEPNNTAKKKMMIWVAKKPLSYLVGEDACLNVIYENEGYGVNPQKVGRKQEEIEDIMFENASGEGGRRDDMIIKKSSDSRQKKEIIGKNVNEKNIWEKRIESEVEMEENKRKRGEVMEETGKQSMK